jgi:hypothetical protein
LLDLKTALMKILEYGSHVASIAIGSRLLGNERSGCYDRRMGSWATIGRVTLPLAALLTFNGCMSAPRIDQARAINLARTQCHDGDDWKVVSNSNGEWWLKERDRAEVFISNGKITECTVATGTRPLPEPH